MAELINDNQSEQMADLEVGIENLRQVTDACLYLEVVILAPLETIQERISTLKEKTGPYRQTPARYYSQEYYYWQAEIEELEELTAYKQKLRRNEIVTEKPNELEVDCLRLCLRQLASSHSFRESELTFAQTEWLIKIFEPGRNYHDNYYAPSRILGRVKSSAKKHLPERELQRESDLMENFEQKRKLLSICRTQHYHNAKRHKQYPPTTPALLRAHIIEEERQRRQKGKTFEEQPAVSETKTPPSKPPQEKEKRKPKALPLNRDTLVWERNQLREKRLDLERDVQTGNRLYADAENRLNELEERERQLTTVIVSMNRIERSELKKRQLLEEGADPTGPQIKQLELETLRERVKTITWQKRNLLPHQTETRDSLEREMTDIEARIKALMTGQ